MTKFKERHKRDAHANVACMRLRTGARRQSRREDVGACRKNI